MEMYKVDYKQSLNTGIDQIYANTSYLYKHPKTANLVPYQDKPKNDLS